jgi:hypothetical protein
VHRRCSAHLGHPSVHRGDVELAGLGTDLVNLAGAHVAGGYSRTIG